MQANPATHVDQPPPPQRDALGSILWRCVRLRCPVCGQGPMFAGFFQMHPECSTCGYRFIRESGFYLGSIYVNYGLTALVVAISYPLLVFYYELPERYVLRATAVWVIAFPILFFRFARCLWLGFDQFLDPKPAPRPVQADERSQDE